MRLPTGRTPEERQRNLLLEQADRQNLKRGADVEFYDNRLILTAPDGTRYRVTVANDGTLGTTAL